MTVDQPDLERADLDQPAIRVTRELLDLPDGRLLDYTWTGPPQGPVLLFHHGTPGGALPDRFLARAAASRGLRLVSPARAGYSRSDRRPGRDVAAVAPDAAALLDALGVEQAYVAGWSGGGPHALACGALLGARVRSVAVIAGVAPYDASGLDFLAGMGDDNVEEFGAALSGEGTLRPWLDHAAAGLTGGDPEQLRAALAGLLSPVDHDALTGEFAEDLTENVDDGLALGIDGWLDDDLAFTRPWGFDLAALAGCRVDVWQGSEDLMVPFAHGRWLAEHVPGVRAHLLPGDGHLSVGIGRIEQILDALLDQEAGGAA